MEVKRQKWPERDGNIGKETGMTGKIYDRPERDGNGGKEMERDECGGKETDQCS